MNKRLAGICHGNGDHCCWLAGVPCPFLEENTIPGRRWACGLYREHGGWAGVHTDPRYLETVKPVWDQYGVVDCGEWYGPNRDGIGSAQCCFGEIETAVSF